MIKTHKSNSTHYTDAPINGTFKYAYDAVAEIFGPLHGKRVLDYGCGTGRSAGVLKELDAKVAGTDIRPDMIRISKQRYPEFDFRLIQDGRIPWPENTFHMAFSGFVHLEIGSYEQMKNIAKEVYRVLKPGGAYIILTANPEMWGNEYECFSSSLPENFTGQSARKIDVKMKTGNGIAEFQDYFWKEGDYVKSLESACFDVVKIKKVTAEKNPPPFLLIKAVK